MKPRGDKKNAERPAPRAPGVGLSSLFRRPWGRLISAAIVVGGALWLALISVAQVGEGERAYRLTLGAGAAEHLGPGRHFVLPLLQRLVRVPPGPIRASSSVKLRSREGIDLEVPFEAEAQMDDKALAAFVGAAGGRDLPQGSLEKAATETINQWGAGAPIESLVLLQGEKQAREKLQERLEAQGFASVSLRLGRVRGPAEAVEAITGRALRDKLSTTGLKIAILGLDGADWEIMDPLLAKGQLPNLARLKARGAWGNMKTMMPWLSPLLWTSVATGKPPEEHGIIDFLMQDKKTGEVVPVTSRARKVKALWNMFSDAGRSSAFVAWWATWPAEPVEGYMISDRVAYSLFGFVSSEPERAGTTWPEGYFNEIRPRLSNAASIHLDEVQRFARVAPEEFAALRRQAEENPKSAYREPINHLRKILASQKSYQAIALDILGRGQPNLFSIYYQGIDEVCHRFAHYMPPKMDMVTAEEFAKYREVVDQYYRYQDQLLGEILGKLSPDTMILVHSDHGFQNGGSRPKDEPPYIEGKPGLWHRRYGILIVAGPVVRPGRLDTSSLLDVAPTVLYLAGLPVAEDMPGRVIREAIEARFLAQYPMSTLASYESVGRALEENRPVVAASDTDPEFIENLRSLGYVGAGAAGPAGGDASGGAGNGGKGRDGDVATGTDGHGQTLITAHLNEAGLYVKNKDYAQAQAALDEALKMQPGFLPALLLQVEVAQALQDHDSAIRIGRSIIESGPERDKGVYLKLGQAYRDAGREMEGIPYFERLRTEHPEMPEVHAALGMLLLEGGRPDAAEKELLEALRLDPSLSDPLSELHKLYRNSPRILTLEPVVRKGLELDDKSLAHLNWLGLIYEWKRDIPRAEQTFKRALELDPDYAPTMANLGALYGRNGRLQEAVEVLSRAVAKDPDNVESWVNLGAAQGRLGRSREAIRALETAREKGVRTTTLYNALALSYLQDHQRDKAVQFLKESLAIDPGQKDAVNLLQSVSRAPR